MKFLGKKSILGSMAIAAACVLGTTEAQAQEFNVQADMVSSYIWRGVYQTGFSIQPTLNFTAGNFGLTAWGSTDLDGNKASQGAASKEIDLTAAYTFGESGLTLSVASLWWAGQGACDYFQFESHKTSHFFEGGLTYVLPCEKFPMSIAWYTMFAGADKNNKGKNNYSSYCELNAPFSVKGVDLNATLGFQPYETYTVGYGNTGFAVSNVALKAIKEIKVTEKFSLPIFAQAIWNPCLNDAHLVFGITLRP